MTVYDSRSGKEIASLPGPETMDGVSYDANLKRIYVSGGRWYGTPEASPGWLFVYQQQDADHYQLISKITTQARLRYFAIRTQTQSPLCRIASDWRSGSRHLGVWTIPLGDARSESHALQFHAPKQLRVRSHDYG
jgi:hypothetical protein